MYKRNPKVTASKEESSITEEQRARISQNFRAAKALLARKRPRADHIVGTPNKRVPLEEISLNSNASTAFKSAEAKLSCSFLSKGVSFSEDKLNHGFSYTAKVEKFFDKEYGNALESEREQVNSGVSLQEESTDMPDLSSTSVYKSAEGGSSTTLCFSVVSNKSNLTDSVCASEAGVSSEYAAESFRTPMTTFKCSGLLDSPMEPGILDDVFDEFILRDIDAFCEQRSNTNTEVQRSDDGLLGSAQNDGIHGADTNIISGTLLGEGDPKTEYTAVSCYSTESKADRVCTLQKDEILKTECDLDHDDVSGMMANGIGKNGSIEGDSMPEEYSKYLQSLNDRQREAACCDISVPLMIVAGPGSGKTSTMVGRILVLLNEGISPSNILAMTFTTAAAAEMRDRIGAVAGKAAAKELMISTFHSFALQLCRMYAEKLDRTQEFLIYGHGQQRRAIIEAIRLLENQKSKENHKVNDDSSDMTSPHHFKNMSNKWQKFVTKAKASGKTHEEYYAMGDEMGAAILRNYSEILRSCNALDYHDLISCAVKLLVDFPEVFEENQVLWKAIVVDEFQDTSSMQYNLLRALASHKCITIIGDDDQSIFSFNGANISGFDSFRKDFPNYKEVRLNKNYRSTRCIVEAASCLIKNNIKRCQLKSVLTDNTFGAKITIKECHNEGAQCAFIVDKILEATSNGLNDKSSHGNIAILYRRQVSGKVFQIAFRERKIPFNLHGVAFYRKKVVKAIIAMLRTTLPNCNDGSHRQVFKALLPFDKEDRKRVIAHIEKVAAMRKCSFIYAASDIFSAKISGTFKRSQLTQGRKVLSTLEIISKLVNREQSISAVITSVANMVPQKYLLEQRAVVNVDGGKLLNEDHDIRSVLQYLLDDVSEVLSTQYVANEGETDVGKENGCVTLLKHFIDYITERERENFLSRRHDNKNSVTLTTIHQSKGLEWDIVFIVKANESEIPLLHESDGVVKENANLLEEERRLFYVAMTRARKKLFILYVTMDNNWQMLPASRFLREIPDHLREVQAEIAVQDIEENHLFSKETCPPRDKALSEVENEACGFSCDQTEKASEELAGLVDLSNGTDFIRRFSTEDRLVVSQLFHQWGKKQAFQDPKRLLAKVGFVIEERLRNTKSKNKDVLRSLKFCLGCDEAFQYAEYVLRWLRIPAEKRAHIMREKQEHFQKLRVEKSMGSSAPTSKQITYLQSLGCTITPTSCLHASRLIEQYKSL